MVDIGEKSLHIPEEQVELVVEEMVVIKIQTPQMVKSILVVEEEVQCQVVVEVVGLAL